jgi:hypothetical protein
VEDVVSRPQQTGIALPRCVSDSPELWHSRGRIADVPKVEGGFTGIHGRRTVQEQASYGELFVKHLTALSRQTPFNYKDLQQIKAMHREDLAERLKSECPEISDFVLSRTAKEVAERVHQKRMELAAAASHGAGAHGAASLLEFVVQLFSATV